MDENNGVMEMAKLIGEIAALMRHNFMKGFDEMGITAPQGMVIGIISKFGKTKISQLSEKMGLSNSTISGIVDRLERQGMVERERSIDDKRVVYVSLSPKFQDLHCGLHKRIEANTQNLVNKGKPEEIAKIKEGLNLLKNLLQSTK